MAQPRTPSELVIAVDFDRTLFDTDAFSDDVVAMLAERSCLPFKKVAEDSRRFSTHPRLGGYDFDAHLRPMDLIPIKHG